MKKQNAQHFLMMMMMILMMLSGLIQWRGKTRSSLSKYMQKNEGYINTMAIQTRYEGKQQERKKR